MPDYSHFQRQLGVAAVKVETHQHVDGCYHLHIEVMLGPEQGGMLEKITSGFDRLMQSLSPVPKLEEVHLTGEAAQNDSPLEDYFYQYHEAFRKGDN